MFFCKFYQYLATYSSDQSPLNKFSEMFDQPPSLLSMRQMTEHQTFPVQQGNQTLLSNFIASASSSGCQIWCSQMRPLFYFLCIKKRHPAAGQSICPLAETAKAHMLSSVSSFLLPDVTRGNYDMESHNHVSTVLTTHVQKLAKILFLGCVTWPN